MFSVLRMILIAAVVLCGSSVAAQEIKQHPAKGAVELGWRYIHKGDADTALDRFNQALNADPNFAPAYFGIAYVYSVQNKLDLAIQNYRKSIEKDPKSSYSYSNLGLALFYAGKPKDALPMLKKALDLDPKNGDAHLNMSLYYFSVGDYPMSWKHVHLAQDNKTTVNLNFHSSLKKKMREPQRKSRT